jgi:hypothetical protein
MSRESQKENMDRMWRRHMQILMKRIYGIKQKEQLKEMLNEDYSD